MPFDITKLASIEKTETVYFNDALDVTFLKVLYENCIRMGGDPNTNIQVATVHPEIWFPDLMDIFLSRIKIVSKTPSFQLVRIEGEFLTQRTYNCETLEFLSDDDFKEFFESKKYKSLVVFSIVRILFIRDLSTRWRIRCTDVSTVQEVRDSKIDELYS